MNSANVRAIALVDEPILSTMDLEIRDFMSGLEFDQLPDEVKEKARLSLVDLVATAAAPAAAVATVGEALVEAAQLLWSVVGTPAR